MKEIVRPTATHLEAARLVASGATWREIGERFQLPNRIVGLWRRSKSIQDKVEEYRRTLSAAGELSPKEAARAVLESHAVKAAEKVGKLLESPDATPKQQLEAAKDILDRTGVVVKERVGNIIIQLNAKDMTDTLQGAIDMGFVKAGPEEAKALPKPAGSPA